MDVTGLLTLADAEQAARAVLDDATWAYVAGGAGAERSVDGNRQAYEQMWLRTRVLGGAGEPDLGVDVFGQPLSLPVLLAPTSPQRLLHPDAELATARAAKAAGTVSIVSSDGHYPYPKVADEAAGTSWFQVYPYGSAALVDTMVDMAQEAGATAIVLTVDAFHRPRRLTTQRTRFQVASDVDFGTLRLLGVLTGDMPADARIDRLSLTWQDIERLRSRTQVPLVLKGVLSAADARRAVDIGADGIVVSNHGGRQLDGAVPALWALENIAAEVAGDCTLLVDGGIRCGADVVAALALGADAVCIGRPYLWGLRLAGESGVTAVLDILRREITDTVRQIGLASVADIDRDCVVSRGVCG